MKLNALLQISEPIVLASASPRRRFLLSMIGLECTAQAADLPEEQIAQGEEPEQYVQKLALHKAQAIAQTLENQSLVIGSDTIVVIDGQILNKPETPEHAFQILSQLSGREHEVLTGVCVYHSGLHTFSCELQRTKVVFRELTDAEKWAYIRTGSPMDKAGAYGIQDDFGAVFVREIQGDYYNVVGLPLELLYRMLQNYSTKVE